MVNCAETNINPYKPRPDKLWDKRKAIHLFRRTSFGVDLTTIKASLNLDPVSVVNKIVDDARTLPPTAPPSWSNWTLSNYSSNQDIRITQIGSQYMEWNTQWIKDMINNGLRDRMSWFWSQSFCHQTGNLFLSIMDVQISCPFTETCSWQFQDLCV
ncbi:MAG: hypothetical protein IPO98_15820 [Saprospiraceae bacterium]|nr:hypothetical protein [Saprospiraceae bacterium]